MKGYRMTPLSGVTADAPPPELHRSPLVTPQGITQARRVPECETCAVQAACLQAVINLQPFALPVCEMASRASSTERKPQPSVAVKQCNAAKVQDALTRLAPCSVQDIADAVHLAPFTVRGHLQALLRQGRAEIAEIRRVRGCPPQTIYRMKGQTTE
jgi:hypothetical protein